MKIIVVPRWHQRSDVKLGLIGLLILSTIGVVYARTSFLLSQKKKLERLVAVRTRLMETQKEEIKDKNRKLLHAYEEVNLVNAELQRLNTSLEKVVESRTEELQQTIKKLIEADEGLNTFLY